MIRLIIFDMDGLMIDSERPTMQAYLDVGKAWGLPVTQEQFFRLLGKNIQDIKKQYREDFGENIDADRLYKEVGRLRDERCREEGIPAKKGLKDLLAMLETEAPDIPLTVASGSNEEVIRHHLNSIGVAHYFKDVLSSKDVRRGKPSPDVFLALCRRFGVAPEETLVLEDSPNGIRAALAGGMKTIAVPDIQPVPGELAGECYALVGDLEEAIPYIARLL